MATWKVKVVKLVSRVQCLGFDIICTKKFHWVSDAVEEKVGGLKGPRLWQILTWNHDDTRAAKWWVTQGNMILTKGNYFQETTNLVVMCHRYFLRHYICHCFWFTGWPSVYAFTFFKMRACFHPIQDQHDASSSPLKHNTWKMNFPLGWTYVQVQMC